MSESVPQRKPLSLPRLREMHARGEKITMLTCLRRHLRRAWLDCRRRRLLLVGDSLGMVLPGP